MNQYEHDGLTDEEYVAWLRKLAKDAKECGGHKLCLELEVAADRIDDLLLHNRILKRSRDAALSELAELRALFAYGRQGGKALPEASEQPAKQITCHAEGERCYGCAHYRGEADVCEFAGAAGLYPLYNELLDLIGECAVTDEMSCSVCRAEEGDDHHDSCPIGIIEEWAHNNLARESPPTNAEAVDRAAVERIAGTFGWTPEDVAEFLSDDDEVVAVTIDERIYEAVAAERAKQREKGDEFDKTNSRNDWITYICRYASGAGDKLWSRQDLEFREAMVKVAALAFAAIEAHDNGYLTEEADGEIPTQGGKPL